MTTLIYVPIVNVKSVMSLTTKVMNVVCIKCQLPHLDQTMYMLAWLGLSGVASN